MIEVILFPPRFPWFIYAYNKTLGIFKFWRKIIARKTIFPDIMARESAFNCISKVLVLLESD
jgi:hypothetical protein